MKEKYRITRNSITLIGGICFILLALVTLLSNNTPFEFLSKAITLIFGFVGFWILVPFILVLGFYLIFKKKIIKLRAGLSLWGAFIVIICFVILSSHWASIGQEVNGVYLDGHSKADGISKYLIFSNSIDVFKNILKDSSGVFDTKLGGGYVGFVVAGALNSAIHPVGLNIICWLLFVGGLLMFFNREVTLIANKIKKARVLRKNKPVKEENYSSIVTKSFDDEEEEIPEPEQIKEEAPVLDTPIAAPSIETPAVEAVERPAIKPIYESFSSSTPINNDYSLKKAHFEAPKEMVIEDSLVKNIEDVVPQKPQFDTSFISQENIESSSLDEEVKESVTIESEEKQFEEPFFAPLLDEKEEQNAPAVETEQNPVTETNEIPAPVEAPSEPVEQAPDFLHMPQPEAHTTANYIYPSLDLLDYHEGDNDAMSNEESCALRTEIINKTLANLKVGAQVVGHTVGPSVTRFDLQCNDDYTVGGIGKYVNDISVRLNGVSVRFEQIVAGKSTSGLEIENEKRTNVGLRESIAALPAGDKYLLNIPFGKDITGELKHATIVDFPHMLVSGTTGSGKSIFIHSALLSLIMRNKPEELKLILIDPKKVEMMYYEDIPHLLCPIITDVKKAYVCFEKLTDEMERRYNIFQANRTRDIKAFNAFAKAHNIQPLPYIIMFVDEYADLAEQCKEIRGPISRIVAKARAAGIHMVIATQRPSVDVIDGVIKSNFSTRVALMSASSQDSTVIIGEGGAEKLLGHGDMLIDCPLISRSTKPRVQGCFVEDYEIERVTDFLKQHYQTQYDPYFLNLEQKVEEKAPASEIAATPIDKSKNEDEQYAQIKEQIVHREFCSISYIQRTFSMGFSRAGKIFNKLVQEGIVAPSGDARGCKVLKFVPADQPVGTIEQSTFIPDDID